MIFIQHVTSAVFYLLGRAYVSYFFAVPLAFGFIYLVLNILKGDRSR